MAVLHGKNYGKPTLDLNFAGNKSLIDTTTGRNYVTFTRAQSGNEATYVGSDGLIKYASADEPRFDHDPETLESLGLLVEESRTNELTYSVITNANWVVVDGATITDNQATAPDGTNTAALINFPAVGVPRISITTSIASGTRMVSCWIKAKTGTVTVRVGNGSDFGSNQVVGTEWTRITEQVPSSSNGAGIYCSNPVSGAEFYAWGFQQEVGTFPTSYIPTSGSTETRAADVASMTASPYLYGTFFAKYKHHPGNNNFRQIFTVGSSNAYTAFVCRTTPAGSVNIVLPGIIELTSTANSETSGINIAATTRVIGDYAVCLNGGTVATSSSTSDNSNNSVITFMYGTIGAVSGGHISRFTYWPKRLPDIELQQLTK